MGNKTYTQINLQQVQCFPTTFRVSLSSMKFHTPRVINLYLADKITEWVHAKTKITQIQTSNWFNKFLPIKMDQN